ncbi:MerR family transcriptional regulator [Kribbella sp. CA-293567]|uniref:MerR family transcriptional regulator n=1 Tax=Kribbella sp. CA-293567 TaxID=3002436 RepID=UPI0022DDC20C|nr:MerR family transcriptional regulator [Kribbella sp. CA-293567]WBQ01834.1 MerR family transcriptional regulator [Kribbella sp. CA-293567]
MFTIGDFAAFGRVSARMLRHYDAIGLLRPAGVDAVTGYRHYTADQLSRLNRIVALKDLGFTLEQVGDIVDAKVGPEELRGMLRLRRAQLEARLSADAIRLDAVEARLRIIEKEGFMSTEDVVLKEIPSVRVAELSAVAASYEGVDIGPVIQPLYGQIWERMGAAGVQAAGLPIAYYEQGDGESVLVHAAVTVSADQMAGPDFQVVDLPALPTAATIVHRGAMSEADQTMQILARWIDDGGYRSVGYAREVCLAFDPEDESKWVHEFQIEVSRP